MSLESRGDIWEALNELTHATVHLRRTARNLAKSGDAKATERAERLAADAEALWETIRTRLEP